MMQSLLSFTQDIVPKTINLSKQGPMRICVHSATGGIRNVALQESAMGGGIVTYEVVLSSFIPEKEKPESKGDDDAPKDIRIVVVNSFSTKKEKPKSKGDDDDPKGI
uniref:AT-hook motif nuclear-localized protein n=1 Tax=Solanum lycopersicum TaxID=4081 RepID=A0A3Q7G4L4_SOLLC